VSTSDPEFERFSRRLDEEWVRERIGGALRPDRVVVTQHKAGRHQPLEGGIQVRH